MNNANAATFNAAAGGITPEVIADFMEIAAHGSNVALMEMIDKHGPGLLHVRDKEDRTALINAVRVGHSGAIHLLVKAGADIDAPDGDGVTAVMIAARSGFKAIVQMLIDRGADMGFMDLQGRTVLHHGVSHRNNNDHKHPMSKKKKELIKLLLERGVRTDITDNKGSTAEALARRFGYKAEADMILAEEKRRREERAAQISLFTEGLPEAVTMKRLKLAHRHHGSWKR